MGGADVADKGMFRLVLDNIHNRFLIPRCAHCSRQLQSFVTKASAFPPQKRGSHNHNLIWYVDNGMMIAFYSSPLHQADQQRENSMKNWDWGPNKDFYGIFSKYSQQKLQFSNIFPCHRILSESCQRRIMWQQVDPICPVPTNRGLPHLPVIIRATTTALLELSSLACFLETPIFRSGVFCPKCAPL